MADVQRAVDAIVCVNPQLVLMQCNTNYTGDVRNFRYIQLNVLRTYRTMYPDMILGLSDHTAGHATVLAAVALGARVIEKHFSDDTGRVGPDHKFSMTPSAWQEMVHRVREVEAALGTGVKQVEANERETVILQRRCIRLAVDVAAGATIRPDQISVLRPCPPGAIPPFMLNEVVGRRLRRPKKAGEHIQWTDLE
jgi:N-acetylneuraminate synthase